MLWQIVVWAAILLGMLYIEATTVALLTIWFAFGALAALICALFGLSFGIQVAVFCMVSGLLLAFLLPHARRKMEVRKTATNADRIIGAEGIVTEMIDEVQGTGQVRVLGAVWSARSAQGITIQTGEKVVVESISGVKAVVSRKA